MARILREIQVANQIHWQVRRHAQWIRALDIRTAKSTSEILVPAGTSKRSRAGAHANRAS